jgi:hypothetical protein
VSLVLLSLNTAGSEQELLICNEWGDSSGAG